MASRRIPGRGSKRTSPSVAASSLAHPDWLQGCGAQRWSPFSATYTVATGSAGPR